MTPDDRSPAALGAAINGAEQVGQLAGQLANEHNLTGAAPHLAAHLVIAHGWTEQTAAALDQLERVRRHQTLPHDGNHHH